jgi:L-cysteine/cystine lyase
MASFQEKLPVIRKNLSQNGETIYLNTGIIGPLSSAAKLAAAQAIFGSADKNAFFPPPNIPVPAKTAVARLINADPGEIALKNSTTHGIYETLFSIDWKAGDEILISDLEHHAILRPALQLQDRYGVGIRYFAAGGEHTVRAFQEALSPKTKLAAFSHVSYFNGGRLPAKELIAAAHQRNVPVLIDGAQSAGAISVDVRDLDVDYYSLPGQKWLFGPQGTGALYVRRSILDAYDPRANQIEKPFPYGEERVFTDIRRFENAPPARIAQAGFAASVNWLLDEVGTEAAFESIAHRVSAFKKGAAGIEGLQILTPESGAGLVSLKPVKADPKELLAFLKEKNILARTVDPFGYVRFSFSYFITPDEVEQVLEALRAYQRK